MVSIEYFVHGTTVDNELGLASGWRQAQLSAKGREQATALGRSIADRGFDRVYTSDLDRAVESARLIFGDERAIVVDARLRECDYGSLAGEPASELKDRATEFIDTPFPGGESYRDVERRMAAFLDDLCDLPDGTRVAIMAHQAPQLALDVLLRGRTWTQAIDEDWRRAGSWQPGWPYELPTPG